MGYESLFFGFGKKATGVIAGVVTSLGGTINKVAKFTGANTIGDSQRTDDGNNVTDNIIQNYTENSFNKTQTITNNKNVNVQNDLNETILGNYTETISGDKQINANKIGLFGVAPVVRQAQATAPTGGVADLIYGVTEQDMINNHEAIITEMRALLLAYGLKTA